MVQAVVAAFQIALMTTDTKAQSSSNKAEVKFTAPEMFVPGESFTLCEEQCWSYIKQFDGDRRAIFRIRRLLFSMGRFGPYPILWPMYGSGDLTQGYCRMSAVFGATFCLECTITKIERRSSSQATEPTSSNEAITTAVTNTSLSSSSPAVSASQSVSPRNDQDDITVHLSNGKQVRTKCVVLSPEWCARAVLITDSSLLPEDCKPSDVSRDFSCSYFYFAYFSSICNDN
ncbi:unnamed protein product [Trichobilharzia regenti]|nr:unnamed protein product [Trichobilharzia regenti]